MVIGLSQTFLMTHQRNKSQISYRNEVVQMVGFKKDRKFNDDHTVTITLSYTFETSEFVIDELPSSCGSCPVGYMCNNDNNEKLHIPCGRRVPLDDDERSPDCKLRSIYQWIKETDGSRKSE